LFPTCGPLVAVAVVDGAMEGEGPSDWGLFQRTWVIVRHGSNASKVSRYAIPGSSGETSVVVRKPIEGDGTALQYGDFARKTSPSEEALAWYCITHAGVFSHKTVLEVGAGLGFAGLVLCSVADLTSLDITDGDPAIVDVLGQNVEMNKDKLRKVPTVKKLLWEKSSDTAGAQYDIIVAADVVYCEDSHEVLLSTLRRSLLPGGYVLMFASRRNGSLDRFLVKARSVFQHVKQSTTYDERVSQLFRGQKCFPVMARLWSDDASEHLSAQLTQVKAEWEKQKEATLLAEQQAEEDRQERELLLKRRRDDLAQRARLRAELIEAREPTPEPQPEAAPPRLVVTHGEGPSDWGFFHRRWHMDPNGDANTKVIIYQVNSKLGDASLEIRRPDPVPLMHGDGARKLSPAGEVLGWYISKHRKMFARKRVLELGCGLGFCGIVAATTTEAASVCLSDGDPVMVAAAKCNVKVNQNETRSLVDVAQIHWENCDQRPTGQFDVVIGADVMYWDASHEALLLTAFQALVPGGQALLFGPKRCGSLDRFVLAAQTGKWGKVEVSASYSPTVNSLFKGMQCLPIMVRLWKPAKQRMARSAPPGGAKGRALREQRAQSLREDEEKVKLDQQQAHKQRRDQLATRHMSRMMRHRSHDVIPSREGNVPQGLLPALSPSRSCSGDLEIVRADRREGRTLCPLPPGPSRTRRTRRMDSPFLGELGVVGYAADRYDLGSLSQR